MFRRVILEQWHSVIPYIAFGLIAGVFNAIVVWTLLLKRPDLDRLSHLPLDEDGPVEETD